MTNYINIWDFSFASKTSKLLVIITTCFGNLFHLQVIWVFWEVNKMKNGENKTKVDWVIW